MILSTKWYFGKMAYELVYMYTEINVSAQTLLLLVGARHDFCRLRRCPDSLQYKEIAFVIMLLVVVDDPEHRPNL